MKILVLDNNTDYAKRLKFYLPKRYVHTQINISDNLEDAKRMMQETAYDVILFDASFDTVGLETLEAYLEKAAFAYLSETNEVVNDRDTIVKYASVTVLYDNICALYEKKKNRVIRKKDKDAEDQPEKKTELITFVPVHGGAGSSTMAAACAISLAEEYKVLYINLEQRPSDAVFFNGEGKSGFSDIVSTLKTKYTEASLLQSIKSVIRKDQKQNADVAFIKGFSNIMDCMFLTEQGIEVFLRLVRENLDYRFVIIDTDFIVSPIMKKLVLCADKVVFVSSGADISNEKLRKLQRYLDILDRDEDYEMPEKYLLLNQYYGMNDELTMAKDMEIIARIARYRTDDHARITSQAVIDVILSKKQIFAKLKPNRKPQDENQK